MATRIETIKTSIDLDRDLTVHTVRREVSVDDIRRHIRSYYEGLVTRLLLWDFSNVEIASITASDVRDLVELTNSYAAKRSGGRTALVFSSASVYGMGRMFDLFKEADDRLAYHASFRDLEAAMEWLDVAAEK
jgi:hypothetical protein